jgi:hypothetical protein
LKLLFTGGIFGDLLFVLVTGNKSVNISDLRGDYGFQLFA